MSYIFVNFPGPFRQKGGDSNKNSRQFLQSRNKRLTIHIISKEEGFFFHIFTMFLMNSTHLCMI